jgi:exodeoxyribonuclease VII large subunit
MADWIFTVSEVGDFIKKSFESDPMLQNISIRGEISDLRKSAAGHIYFTLKDERSLLKSVWFKQDQKLSGNITEGLKVTTRGRLSYYSEQGQLNYYIREIKSDGVGNLYLLFEQRKERFRLKGYFDAENKKPLPPFPASIGVVTSPTGAVIRDIIRIAMRRNPGVRIVLYPVKVQGEGAAAEIAKGIETFNSRSNVDVLIVGRGGGSFEDLWEFNDEAVVAAIHKSNIPVVTAIGHETDFSLADFSADIRAATPSEAAELIVPNVMDLANHVNALSGRLKRQSENALSQREQRIAYLRQALDLHGPKDKLVRAELKLDNLSDRMQTSIEASLAKYGASVENYGNRLCGLNPAAVLDRGYAAIYSLDKKSYAARGADLAKDENIRIVFSDRARTGRITDGNGG